MTILLYLFYNPPVKYGTNENCAKAAKLQMKFNILTSAFKITQQPLGK